MRILKLTLTCHLDFGKEEIHLLDEIRLHSSKFYNMTLYEMREGRVFSQNEFYNLFLEHFRSGYLQMHTYVNAIKQAMKDMKSFYALLKKFQKNPNINQNPGQPRYKHENNLLDAVFLKTAIRIKNKCLLLSIGKNMKSEKQIKDINVALPEEVYSLLFDKNIKMIKLSYDNYLGRYVARIIYEVADKKLKVTGDIMSIDLGVKNLAAITFMKNPKQYLIDGNVLKSKIATFNKQLKESYSKEMSIIGNSNFRLTKKMKRQLKKRNGYIDNYIHTASKKIIDIAESNDVKLLIIGDFKRIKSENKIKYFVQIPHRRLIEQLKYKGKLRVINVVMQKEYYTSSVSSLDLEASNEYYSDDTRRIVRGLFKSSFGYINADINASLNIMMKYYKSKNIPRPEESTEEVLNLQPALILQVRDKGFRENPIRLLVI